MNIRAGRDSFIYVFILINKYVLVLNYLLVLGARDTVVKKLDQVEGRVAFLKEESNKYTDTHGAGIGESERVLEAHWRGTQLI